MRKPRIAHALVRFLAYGGAPRAERARLGSWPEIPSGLLLDARGIAPGAPAFGLGMLQGRPFLIHRELSGEGAEATSYSLLLEPRPEDFGRFRWNAAWLLASLLADGSARRLLLQEPELATAETLAGLLDRCTPLGLVEARAPEVLAGLLARATLEPGQFATSLAGVSSEGRPSPIDFAAALEGLPIAFRTGRGWLVGGVESHARILGCALLLGEPSAGPADPTPGLAALDRLERLAGSNAAVAELLATPRSDWGSRGEALIHSLKILGMLETRAVQAWELLGSVPAREGPLAKEIRSAALRTMDDSSAALGFEATALLLEEGEAGRRRLASAAVERLDRGALVRHFSTRGIPPAPWPVWIEIPPALKAEQWTRLVGSAQNGWAALATGALEDVAPDGGRSDAALGVILAGIEAARERGGSPLDWESFAAPPAYPELRPLLAQWARENVLRMRGNWAITYLVLGDDPGGSALARANVPAPVAGRLVMAIREALREPHEESARAWLESLATSVLRDLVPMMIKLELPATAGGRWAALERLRQAYEGTLASPETAPPEERPFLRRELEALAQRAPAGPPDLSALGAQLGGELPERTLRAVTRWMKPSQPDEPHAIAGWLAHVAGRLGMGKPRTEAHTHVAGPPPDSMPPPPAAPSEITTAAGPARAEPPRAPAPARGAEPAPARESEHQPAPTDAHQAPADLKEHLREWILGGDVEDDRRADEEMIRLFEQGSARDLAAARTALEGFSGGMLYRLAARAALNSRLLDGVSHAVDSGTLDRIVSDAAHYDLCGFARQAAERLRRYRSEGSSGAADEAVLRLLRSGPREVREGLAQQLRASDGALLAELVGRDS